MMDCFPDAGGVYANAKSIIVVVVLFAIAQKIPG